MTFTQTIPSITVGPRQSNFELLRIVAMMLVIVIHFSNLGIGYPDSYQFATNPINAWFRTFISSASIVCVNTFIMISGWFHIRPTIKNTCTFLFQVFFFSIGIYAVSLLLGYSKLNIEGIKDALMLTGKIWFVAAYLGLFMLSPFLNAYLEKASEKSLRIFLICFYCFQTYFGIFHGALFIQGGFSTFSFIGLYVLASYLRNYGQRLAGYGLLIYIFSIIINSILFYVARKGIYNYANPFVVMGAAGLTLWFSRIELKPNKFINFIAKSCFAVYLFHCNPNIDFGIVVRKIYYHNSGMTCFLLISAYALALFAAGIIADQLRRWIWDRISKPLMRIKNQALTTPPSDNTK